MYKTSYQRRKHSLEAIKFFAEHLFKRNKRLASNLTINLKFKDLKDAWGICDPLDVNIRPREFTILIDRKLEGKDITQTIAHEMVHVWQYATGKLKNYDAPVCRYEGHLYDAGMSYRDMPWEIEARRLERLLYKLYIKSQSVR